MKISFCYTSKRILNSILIIISILIFIIILWGLFITIPLKSLRPYVFGMAGFNTPQTYLLIIQNNSERRPTGGFITAYGILTFDHGKINLDLKDSYDFPKIPHSIDPPLDFQRLLAPYAYPNLQFRDSNWSPDFPTSAKKLIKIYNEAHLATKKQQKFAGVISIDFSAIKAFLEIVKNIQIKDINFTPTNLFHKMQFYSKSIDLHSVDNLDTRKNIMKDFSQTLIQKLKNNPLTYQQNIKTIKKMLKQKHLQLFFINPEWQKVIDQQKWSGRLNFTKDKTDFIHINTANVLGRKADRYIQRNYSYTVYFTDNNNPKVELRLDFFHSGAFGLYSDQYQSYNRVYLPLGINNMIFTKNTKKDQELKSFSEFKYSVFSFDMKLKPGERKIFTFNYDLPSYISAKNYKLWLSPMSGNFGENWQVILRNSNIDNFWKSDDFIVRESSATFNNQISKNTLLVAKKLADTTPPVIVWQKFLDKETIELGFSEQLSSTVTKNYNFKVIDKNIKNNQITDKLTITNVELYNNYTILLSIEGISKQDKGEHFTLFLENILDLSGNYLPESQTKITIVQDF